MGNVSQPNDPDICRAAIKAFQYGWGSVNSGNHCTVTIVDERGGQFSSWMERIAKNAEGAATPVFGVYRMVVQFGWYGEGNGDTDICGQPVALPNTQPADGENHSFLLCSPELYFLPGRINVRYEGNKFIYDVEGTDLVYRSQQQVVANMFGGDDAQMYFVEAVHRLGLVSNPPFRVEFMGRDDGGQLTRMNFVTREGHPQDDPCWGPYDVWKVTNRTPLATIQEWIRNKAVRAVDLTGITESGEVGIVMNYDSTYKWTEATAQCKIAPCPVPADCNPLPPRPGCPPSELCECTDRLPQYGRLLLWQSIMPYCQGNFTDDYIISLMRAVYIVNGGSCSPVIAFNPVFEWNFFAGSKAGDGTGGNAVTGTQKTQQNATVATKCNISSSRGTPVYQTVAHSDTAVKINDSGNQQGKAAFHQGMAGMPSSAVQAELRVQGDPSAWLCSPALGAGRTVGIIFVNPQFLIPGEDDEACPVWSAIDPACPGSAESNSVCNSILTSRGWFIEGVDHQIRDGTYITSLKLRLSSPGTDLLDASDLTPVNLGADPDGGALVRGGKFAFVNRFPVGSAAAAWRASEKSPDTCAECTESLWTGGGSDCDPSDIDCSGYDAP